MLRHKNTLDIITYGHPDLVRPSAPIERVDQEIRELIRDMFRTMYKAPGVGLAAPQVHVLKRLCVIGFDEGGRHEELALINPRITGFFGPESSYDEGCLSVPGIHSVILRPSGVMVEAIDVNEQPLKFQVDGFMARVLQHEIDHLDGVLFVDRLESNERESLSRSLERIEARAQKKLSSAERRA